MVRSKSWKRSCDSFSDRRIERPALLTTKSTDGSSAMICSQSAVDRLEVGQVAREDVRRAAAQLDRRLGLLELVLAAGDQHRDAAGLGDLERGDLADAGRGAGDHDVLAGRAPRGSRGRGRSRCRGAPPSSPTACGRSDSRSGTPIPDPASAFSVRRESKSAVKLVCASTSAGTPSRPTVRSSTRLDRRRPEHAAGDRQRPQPPRHERERSGAGQPPVDRGQRTAAPRRPRRTG